MHFLSVGQLSKTEISTKLNDFSFMELTFYTLGNLAFLKINYFKIFFQEYYQSDKLDQGQRSDGPDMGLNCLLNHQQQRNLLWLFFLFSDDTF